MTPWIALTVATPGATAAADSVERQLQAQRNSPARAPRIMLAVWTDPLYVAGSGSFTADPAGSIALSPHFVATSASVDQREQPNPYVQSATLI